MFLDMVLSIGVQLQVRGVAMHPRVLSLSRRQWELGGRRQQRFLEDMTLESVSNNGWGTAVQQRVGQWALQAEEAVGASWRIGDL